MLSLTAGYIDVEYCQKVCLHLERLYKFESDLQRY